MIYVGHFSFARSGEGPGPDEWHAVFTLVAEAGSVEVAHQKFRRLIEDVVVKQELGEGTSAIYLDACVELKAVPRGGIVTYLKLIEGEDKSGIAAALLGNRSRSAVAYAWGEEPESDSGESYEAKPFVRLRHGKKASTVGLASKSPRPRRVTKKPDHIQ